MRHFNEERCTEKRNKYNVQQKLLYGKNISMKTRFLVQINYQMKACRCIDYMSRKRTSRICHIFLSYNGKRSLSID